MPIKRVEISNGDGAVAFPVAEGRRHFVGVRLTSGSGTLVLRSVVNGQRKDILSYTTSEDLEIGSVSGEWELEVTSGTCTFEVTATPQRK